MTAENLPEIFLIDGYALIYRAFFAMISRPLRTSRGENTSAVWGVANFLHRLFERHDPGYVAWVHDAGTSFRTEQYPEYKATRQKLDDELQADFDRSIERVETLLDAFNITLVEVDGYEADDVIGTLAAKATEQNLRAIIVSGDKDFYQLISRNVLLLNPGRGGPSPVSEELIGVENASDRLGVPPERVVDYLALVGDSSDNVPGVKGIGDKTARSLIEIYGDLDAIIEHREEVKGKRAREALIAHEAEARLSRELVTIRCDVPVELDTERLQVRSPDSTSLLRIYSELEFNSLTKKVGSPRAEPTVASAAHRVVASPSELAEIVKTLRGARHVCVDACSDGEAARGSLVGLGLAVSQGSAWYFPFEHGSAVGELSVGDPRVNLPQLDAPEMGPLTQLLEDATVAKVGHDVKRSFLALRNAGVRLNGVTRDSMLESFVLDPGRRSHALDALAREFLDIQLPQRRRAGKGKGRVRAFSELALDEAAAISCATVNASLMLQEHFDRLIDQVNAGSLLRSIEIPLIEVLADMEWRGIAIDVERLAQLSREFADELSQIERDIYDHAGTEFNIKSTPQLRHILFEKLQLPVMRKTKTGASTDAAVLGQLAAMGYEVPQLLLSYRELSKLKSTYVDVLPESVNRATRRVHTSFNQTGAATGRLSSSNPNLQNIPVRTARGELIRQCFVPASGCRFVVADYSQIELRVLAHLSQDPKFISAFASGEDIHRETAAIIFDVSVSDVTPDMRARAKTINFATIYGQGPFALSRQLDISQEEAKDFIRLYFDRFSGVRTFLDDTVRQARDRGYVETIFGRRRYIPELHDSNYNVRAFGERTAMNSPMQGSAADLIKIAMINLARALRGTGLKTGMLLQVHDELVLEAPIEEIDTVCGLVRTEMENAARLSVPLVVDIGVGDNWLDAKR
ncbi:MAG: DNA polymerase I [Gemmatimonadales bacterium]